VADDPRTPHLLFVVWGFPPCRGSGVYRALATANGFAENGWDVTVLTCDREVFFRYTGADPALEPLVDPRVDVVRVPFAWPALDPDVSHYSAFRALAPRLWARSRVRRDQIPFPERGYGPWRGQLEQAAERIHQARPVDLVVYTANPNVTGTAAWYLHSRHGVPYVIDYRDAWSLNVFTGARIVKPNSRAGRWERRLMESAREAWFVNEPLRAWHAEVYPSTADRMHVVANGYDVGFAPEPAGAAPDAADGLTFGYLGTVAGPGAAGAFRAGMAAGPRTLGPHGTIPRRVPRLPRALSGPEPGDAVGHRVRSRRRGPLCRAGVEDARARGLCRLRRVPAGPRDRSVCVVRKGLRVSAHRAAGGVGARPRQRRQRCAARVPVVVPRCGPDCRGHRRRAHRGR